MENLTQELKDKIVLLHYEGLSASKIAQKTRTKKAVIIELLGAAVKDGIGSDLKDIGEAIGLDVVADKVAKLLGADDCGCAARAEKLNKLYPRRTLNDLSNEDYESLKEFFSTNKSSVNTPTQKKLLYIYNNVFNSRRSVSNCGPCVASMIRELRTIFDAV
tara:strand:- start:333 stop:815 length:483 start_codon:yes stop_codon:yes gene_type:complete